LTNQPNFGLQYLLRFCASILELRSESSGDIRMEFRLIYDGALPAHATKSKDAKHAVRKQLHKQLAELWKRHIFLQFYLKTFTSHTTDDQGNIVPLGPLVIDEMANNHKLGSFRFVPLVGNEQFGDAACALDILFLRRDKPGQLISGGGDIDNRIKLLFDALKMPRHSNELPSDPPASDENPLYCLLEDDSLITEVKVTTDQLLVPVAPDEHENDVHLVIHVNVFKNHTLW
jgi:hypothetical protein